MERYVYCPNESHLEKAIDLSKITYLPILIGESKKINNLYFDRDKVSIIKIPEYREIILQNNIVKQGFHQNIKYINEFYILKNNIKLLINDNIIPSLYEEQHIVKFNFLCEKSGNYNCVIMISDEKIEEFSFAVH